VEATPILSNQLKEYEAYKLKLQELSIELARENNNNMKLQMSVKDLENKLNISNDKIVHTEERYRQKIENIQRTLTFEKDKALLEQEKSLRNELQAAINEYNYKIKVLLDELEIRQKEKVIEKEEKTSVENKS